METGAEMLKMRPKIKKIAFFLLKRGKNDLSLQMLTQNIYVQHIPKPNF